MKQSRITAVLFSAVLLFFFTSCGNNADEKTTTVDTAAASTTDNAVVTPPPVSTIVTTPANMAIITHKVKDFSKWLAGYEAHDSARLANGLHNYVIGRGFTDTNMVLVALKVDDVAKAKAFSKDANLKTAMQKSGVVGAPEITVGVATWQDTAALAGAIRSRTTMSVKDWDIWIKSFEEGRQERIDNGIVDRVISHDADDNKKVGLVTAVTDTAKAFAYYKSDALKKRREAGGVIGEPKRFLFIIAKRY